VRAVPDVLVNGGLGEYQRHFFGASIEKTAAKGKARILVPAREIVARSPATIEIIHGVLEQECLNLY
jgi:hypothetical protein